MKTYHLNVLIYFFISFSKEDKIVTLYKNKGEFSIMHED